MSDLIQKILDDRAIIRAFSDEQIEVLRSVLTAHLATAPEVRVVEAIQSEQKLSFDAGNAITIYVDGSCSGNPGPGGWAAWFPETGQQLVGGDDATTNNRMEILGAAKAIAATPEGSTIDLFTDSKLVVETMAGNYGKKSNIDLWQQLDAACKGRTVRCHWVRGHNGDVGNEKANELAQAETIRRKEAIARAAKAA